MARLQLLCSASTRSVRAAAFPSDEPLEPYGRRSLSLLSGHLPTSDGILRSPALCAAQTAEGLGLDALIEPSLRDCDFGHWAGRALADIEAREPDSLAEWLSDPHAAPHGGESFAEVTKRVGIWMDGLPADAGTILGITHANIIRAAIVHALGVEPRAFPRIDVAPLARAKLSGAGGRWRFSALTPLKEV
jgi:broad specificity phosphatase PhoE